ncbi:MAG: 30S ribosomal protein S8 [Verrucomicrobiota bacterium]|jgi:small subunit ribosomal protein S8|nr:30S ribosomal protein S8 [Verrucomicrobiota bacterium]|tara:strand:+ start:765 stop:1148 length:384 start_codon:yes stop_codon:yes gene_type:complete
MDPIANMLTCVRNASQALLDEVAIPHSKIKENIARILKNEGYIAEFGVEGDAKKTLKMKLKYSGRRGVIEGLKRVSRPGLRQYVSATEVPRVLGGLGVAILSTSKGVMTGQDARKESVGGEVLCHVW